MTELELIALITLWLATLEIRSRMMARAMRRLDSGSQGGTRVR